MKPTNNAFDPTDPAFTEPHGRFWAAVALASAAALLALGDPTSLAPEAQAAGHLGAAIAAPAAPAAPALPAHERLESVREVELSASVPGAVARLDGVEIPLPATVAVPRGETRVVEVLGSGHAMRRVRLSGARAAVAVELERP